MAKKGQASRTLVWIILGLLIVGLAGFGATNFGGSVRVVGSVGDTEIDTNDYARALQQEMRALSQNTGTNVTMAQARAIGLDQSVLSRLVSQAALDNEARNLGLSVGDEEVRRQVLDIQAFRGLDGEFDREAYQFALRNNGLTVAEFENQVREDTARNILQASVVGGLATPDVLTDTLYNWARERRAISWVRLGADDLETPLPEPSEADLSAFHSANPELFTLPETRVITYAWIVPEMLTDGITPSEQQIRDLYQERIDEYVRPERRLVERLIFGSEDDAQAASQRITSGDITFEQLVEERGLTLDDIDLGDVTEADLGDAGPGVFALEDTGVTGPLPTNLGPALFRVNAILSATETSFEDVRDEIAAEVASDRARREIDAMLGEFDDLLAGGATLEELAKDTQMELGTIEFRSDQSDGIAAYQEFRDRAMLVTESAFPELFEFDQGGVFALRLDEIRPPALQPLEDVRPEVIAAWENAETLDLLTSRLQEAQTLLEGGAPIGETGLTFAIEADLRRDGFLDGAPPQMVENVFQMNEGDVRIFRSADAVALVKLDAVLPPDPNDEEALALKSAFSQRADQALAADALELYSRAVQAGAGIQINQQAISAVHSQFP